MRGIEEGEIKMKENTTNYRKIDGQVARESEIKDLGGRLVTKTDVFPVFENGIPEELKRARSKFLRQSFRIDLFMEGLGLNFVPGKPLKLGDLLGVDDDCLLRMLRGVMNKPKMDFYGSDKASIFWRAEGQYASDKFWFGMNADTRLYYNNAGYLHDPFEPLGSFRAFNSVCTKVKAYLVSYSVGNNGQITLWPAETLGTEMVAVYCEAQWGGPNSETRGIIPRKPLDNMLFQDRVESKGGKEGVDYCLFAIGPWWEKDIANNLQIIYDCRRHAEDIFCKKYTLLAKKQPAIDAAAEQYREAERQIAELISECQANPVARKPFVEAPNAEMFSLGKMTQPSLDMTPDELANAIEVMADPKPIQQRLEEVQIIARKWAEFAPQIAELYDPLKAVSVKLNVGVTAAKITYADERILGEICEKKVDFDAFQLQVLLDWLYDRLDKYGKAVMSNAERSAVISRAFGKE